MLRSLALGADHEWFTTVVDGGVDAVVRGTPELPPDPVLRAEMVVAGQELMRSCFVTLAQDPVLDPDVPAAALEFARTLARRGLGAGVLLKAFRVGQGYLWQVGMRRGEPLVADPALRMEVLGLAWERLNRWMEFVLQRISDAHAEERDRAVRGTLALRHATIDAILAGERPDVDQAGRRLGHSLRREHVALVLWARPSSTEANALPRLERLAGELAAAWGAGQPLVRPSGAHELCCWIDGSPAGTVASAATARLLELGDARVAMGSPAPGLDGFVRSHEEARAAQVVALTTRRPEPVTRYADVELVSIISRDPPAMRHLMTRELRGLTGNDPTSERLRTTALAYLAADGSTSAAAEHLRTHKNTVTYRVRQAEDRLGRPLRERRLELELALLLADALGIDDTPSR